MGDIVVHCCREAWIGLFVVFVLSSVGLAQSDPTAPNLPPAPTAEAEPEVPFPLETLRNSPNELRRSQAVDETARKVNELREAAIRNFQKRRYQEAEKRLVDLVTLKQFEVDYHFGLALTYRRQNEFQKAYAKYENVLELGGSKQVVYLLMAEVHAKNNKRAEAFDALRKAAQNGLNIIEAVGHLSALKPYQNQTEFIKLALHLERFELTSEGYRDPFLPSEIWSAPFEDVTQGPGSERTGGPGNLTQEEQEEMLEKAEALLKRVQIYLRLEDEDRAMVQFNKLNQLLKDKEKISLTPIRKQFDRIVAQRDEIAARLDEARLKFFYKQAQKVLTQMQEAFEDTDFTQVEKLHEDLLSVASEMDRANEKFAPVAERVRNAGKYWVNRSRIRIEFQQKNLNIHGIVLSEQGHMVIVNNRSLGIGDRMEDFQVVAVERNRVTFRYKGENIGLVFRRY